MHRIAILLLFQGNYYYYYLVLLQYVDSLVVEKYPVNCLLFESERVRRCGNISREMRNK